MLGGRLRLDGGAMFGVVPRPLWSRACDADERNRIANACRCLLVRTDEHTVLVETGCGERFDAKARDIYDIDAGATLAASLAAAGVTASDITHVVLTHLHFDHAGGAILERQGATVPAFPDAIHVVQRGEWDDARAGVSIMRASYVADDLDALADTVTWEFTEGDGDVLPGVAVQVTGGHTRCHQSVWIHGARGTVVYPGDILPTRNHLRPYWIMAYDMHPYDTLTQKQALMRRICDDDCILAWDHDPDLTFSRLTADDRGGYRAVPLESAS